uniref:Uncharacterized protein n=1 Tax=Stegastes partitus TaxID=144197 RepID=A0A3B5AQU8_9TELE
MDDWDAIPTVVPSKDPPLQIGIFSPGECSYMTSWALSWRRRGSRSLDLHCRKLLRVSIGLFSTRILSRSLQISRPVRATRTFRGR